MNMKWEWTIPNVLSLMRIVLVPVFAVLYLFSDRHPDLLYWSFATLALSGITDMFDGMIARRCHQITEIGKVLDPVADKLTQVTVVLCLAVRIPRLWPLLALCAVKEILQSIGAALLLLRKKAPAESARWYGKVSTVVFYVAMAMFVVFPPAPDTPLLFGWNMPRELCGVLTGVVAGCMGFAFYEYVRLFLKISRNLKSDGSASESHADKTA